MVFSADVITPDGILYINVAKLIGEGNWQGVYNNGFYSLYPFIIVLFQKVFQNWETSGRMAAAILGSLTVLPLFFLFRRMFDLRIAAVASIFFILSPRIVQYSSDVLREPVFWCFSTTALWAGWKGIAQKKWVFVVIASFFVGLSCFTRMEGVALFVIIALWMGWVLIYRKGEIKRCFVLLMVFLISFPAIFISPLYFLKSRTGNWELGHVATKIPDLLKNESKADEREHGSSSRKSSETGSVFDNVTSNKYVFAVWESSYKYFRSFHVILIFLFLFGVIRRKVIPYSEKEVPVLIWCSVFFLVSLMYAFKVSYVSTRHGLLVGIPSLLWVSMGFFELSTRIEKIVRKTRWNTKVSRYTTICLLILICMSMLPKTLSSSGHEKIEMKKAGIHLGNIGYSNERFAVEPRINRLAFYKGGDFINIPTGIDYVTLDCFLKRADVNFLVVDERTIENSVGGFKSHAETMNLERLNVPEFQNYKEYSFAVYRIKKSRTRR